MAEWKDSRWHGDILSDKDREKVFREYCKELAKHEEEKRRKKERYIYYIPYIYDGVVKILRRKYSIGKRRAKEREKRPCNGCANKMNEKLVGTVKSS